MIDWLWAIEIDKLETRNYYIDWFVVLLQEKREPHMASSAVRQTGVL